MRSHLQESFELHVQLLMGVDVVLAIVDGAHPSAGRATVTPCDDPWLPGPARPGRHASPRRCDR
jgi:hypothetical protein